MKKLLLTYILLIISIITFGQRELDPFSMSIDTVKYQNEIRTNKTSVHHIFKNGSFNRDSVSDLYFYPREMSLSKLDRLYGYEYMKFYSHRIKNNAAFNKISDCDFFFEAAVGHYGVILERIVARFNGKYYFENQFNSLLNNMGLLQTMSAEDKIHIIAQWRYWSTAPNIELANIENTFKRPSSEYTIMRPNFEDSTKIEEVTISRIYRTDYKGVFIINGEECEFEARIIRDDRQLQRLRIKCYENQPADFMPGIITEPSTKTGSNIKLFDNNTEINYCQQDNYKVFYYDYKNTTTATNNHYNLRLYGFSDLHSSKKIQLKRRITSTITEGPYELPAGTHISGDDYEFNLQSADLTSGYYSIEYLDKDNNWEEIQGVILLPQNVETINLAQGKTANIYYLEQFFGTNSSEYIDREDIKPVVDHILDNLNTYDILPNEPSFNIVLQAKQGITPITDFHLNMGVLELGVFHMPGVDNLPTIHTLSGYTYYFLNNSGSSVYAMGNYELPKNIMAATLAHEIFHWVSYNICSFFQSANHYDLSFINEGLSCMAQTVLLQNDYNVEKGYDRMLSRRGNYHLTGPYSWYLFVNNLNQHYDLQKSWLFFYYMLEQYDMQSIIDMLTKLSDFAPYNSVTNRNNNISKLFAYLFSDNKDKVFGGFATELLKKEYLTGMDGFWLNYNLINTTTIAEETNYKCHDIAANYTSTHIFKKSVPTGETIDQIKFRIFEVTTLGEQDKTGDFVVATAIWDANNNYINNSLSTYYIQSSSVSLHTIDVSPVSSNEYLMVLVQKLNDHDDNNEATRFRLYFDEGEDGIICNFFSNPGSPIPVDQTVSFTAYCLEGDINEYHWNFPGGYPNYSEDQNPTVVYDTPGLYDVTCTFIRENADNIPIHKNNYVHVIEAEYDDPNIICAGSQIGDKSVVFFVSYEGDFPSGSTFEYILYYGDGEYAILTGNSSFEHFPQYDYNEYGTYNPYVIVNVNYESFSSTCDIIDLQDPAGPCADFSVNFSWGTNPEPNEYITFNPAVNSGTPPYTYFWAICTIPSETELCTGGFNTVVQNPGYTYEDEGHYPIFLSVTDDSDNGCLAQVKKMVVVKKKTSCWQLYVYCAHDNSNQPIERLFLKKSENGVDCGLELFWSFDYLYECAVGESSPGCCPCCLQQPNLLQRPNQIYKNILQTGSGNYYVDSHTLSEDQLLQVAHKTYIRDISSLDAGSYPFRLWVNTVNPSFNCSSFSCSAIKDVFLDIIDCGWHSTFQGVGGEIFNNAINSSPNHSSGSFYVDNSANSYINENTTILNSCKGIVLANGFQTGAKPFIANADAGFTDCFETASNKSLFDINLIDFIYLQEEQAFINTGNDVDTSDYCLDIDGDLLFDAMPVPFKDNLRIGFEISNDADIVINLYNVHGGFISSLVKHSLVSGSYAFDIDLSYLKSGTYFLQFIKNNKYVKTKKLIKSKI